MVSANQIKFIGDWSKEIDVPLQNAMNIGIELAGESGAKACRRAIIYMANAAKNLTKIAPKKRKVRRDKDVPGRGGEYVETYTGEGAVSRLYRFMFSDPFFATVVGKFEDAVKIGARGLARRSWFWGLSEIMPPKDSRPPIPGVGKLHTILGQNESGYMLENRLNYIDQVTPANVENQAARKASERIMAAEANKMMRRFGTSIRELKRSTGLKRSTDVGRYFLRKTLEAGVPLS